MTVCVIGSINLDLVASVARLPAPGETVSALGLERFGGGKGANQALASARWGAATAMVGAVGDDDAGRELLARLAAAGVDVAGVTRLAGVATGQAFISVSNTGENAIVVVGGANAMLTPERAASVHLDGCGVVLAQMETPARSTAALFASAPAGTRRILNAAPALDEARALFPKADIVIVNQTELARFAGESASIGAAAMRLRARPEQSVIVTLGADGAFALSPAGEMRVAGRAAAVTDTTGAGDCFCGVLAAALDQKETLERALELANAAAAVATETLGAAVPTDLRARVAGLGL